MVYRLKSYTPKKAYIPKHVKHEESLQKQVCHYLRMQYPQVIFRSDYASGMHLTMNQAVQHKRLQSSRAWPDLFVYMPSRGYHGLALELKKEGTSIIVSRGERKGHLVSNPHIQEQFLLLKELNKLGYYANFAVGFEAAKERIDWYMKAVRPEPMTLL